MSTKLESKLQEIEERCDKATEGPWKWYTVGSGDYEVLSGPPDDLEYVSINKNTVMDDGSAAGEYGPEITADSPDGQFIAHARTDIPKLLALVKKLIEQRDSILGYARPTSLKSKLDAELLSILEPRKDG